MFFHRLLFSFLTIHQLGYASSRLVNLNPLDGRDLEPALFDDPPLLMADTSNNPINPCTGQVDHLSSSLSNDDVNLFTRDPNPELNQCLPPVNIGAEPLNLKLFNDPLSVLENLVTKDKTPSGGKGPNGLGPGGPEIPGIPGLPDEDDFDRGVELWPIPDESGWKKYEGPVYGPEGFRDGSYGSERLQEEDEVLEDDDEEDDDGPCLGNYIWDLCCDGPPTVPTTPGTVWQYDAVEECDWSNYFLFLFLLIFFGGDKLIIPSSGISMDPHPPQFLDLMMISTSLTFPLSLFFTVSALVGSVLYVCPKAYHVCCQKFVSSHPFFFFTKKSNHWFSFVTSRIVELKPYTSAPNLTLSYFSTFPLFSFFAPPALPNEIRQLY